MVARITLNMYVSRDLASYFEKTKTKQKKQQEGDGEKQIGL